MRIREWIKGRLVPDPKPIEIPAGMKRPESLQDMVRRMVQVQVSEAAAVRGFETVDEANDFEVDSDELEDRVSGYQQMAEEIEESADVREVRERAKLAGEVRRRSGAKSGESPASESRGKGNARRESESESHGEDSRPARARGTRYGENDHPRSDRRFGDSRAEGRDSERD